MTRSTSPSQNVQNTPGSEHFWKLRCRKSVHRCGAKHIFKSTCTKCTRFGALLEVEMSKKGTPLWREAHLEVEMSLRMACVRDCAPCQKLLKGEGFVPVSATTLQLQLQLHYATLINYITLNTLHSPTLHYTNYSYNYNHNTPHYTKPQLQLQLQLHLQPQHIRLHYTTLHSVTLRYTTVQLQLQLQLRYATLITLHYINHTALHYSNATLHYTTHYTTLH